MIEDIIKAVASKLDWILENYSSKEGNLVIYCKDSRSGKEEVISIGSEYPCIIDLDRGCDLCEYFIYYKPGYPDELKDLTLSEAQTFLESDTFEIRYDK